MARATGADVIVELMTTVAALKDSMKQQGDAMAQLATQMKGNVTWFGRLAKLLTLFSAQTDQRFDELDGRLEAASGPSGK